MNTQMTLDTVVPSIDEYERLIQKLEGDIRQHIRVEAQLKLHIESLMGNHEEKDRSQNGQLQMAVKMAQDLKAENMTLRKQVSTKNAKIAELLK